ncbi:hypothetical protein [Tenacibaculum finnmarkense]|uniref:hypothetical protein n=1 Tax=Tenacibaculum finnmarkense TaxID=2781243 RepID=UPI001EFC0BDE|nr:hypothetical protein [Tenacibaculum finnmarkense]MCG8753424.1 hypothetical protein [Tenacibaculum finnmarkense]MCG8782333.1 hypothetical protein [Tenacibaculum finnmarkense]
MKYLIPFFLAPLLFLNTCKSEGKSPEFKEQAIPEPKEQINENFNIIITPDLSNRIESNRYPKPVSDTTLIKNIYSSYYPDLYKIKSRVMGQKDKIQFVLTNPSIISSFNINLNDLTMDISKYSSNERIKYVANGGNKEDLIKCNYEIKNIYKKARNHTTGGDVYNYLKKQITTTVIKKNKEPIVVGNFTVKNIYRNIIVLFTDGYIEAGLYGSKSCIDKKCYYLSKNKINKFRADFLASGNPDLKSFFDASGYGIIPVENKALENVEIIVAEMYDRSLSRSTGSQTVSPNDFEIMKLFWADWLTKSGVKHYRLLQTSNTKEDLFANIKEFIEEK